MSALSLDSTDSGPALLIERFLLEQSELTAVERFAQRHEHSELPARAEFYRDLIPLSGPAPGEQYAFRVDLDSCSGCKACVAACHELNGLEDEETWRDVGLLIGTDAALPILQHVTTACHHCLEPGCLAGCPVRAYDKDPLTGIVRHLDDQCIGCQYCLWTCPYEVPKYSAKKGIVRKCDMCRQRLSVGEAPACVQACPNAAISIELANVDEIRSRTQSGEFFSSPVGQGSSSDVRSLAGLTDSPSTRSAPDARLTRPTTRYVTQRVGLELASSVDECRDVPQHAHWPLIGMLVLTQLSVGTLLCERLFWAMSFFGLLEANWPAIQKALALGSWICAVLGMGIVNTHLGRPWLAFRAILGWRTSWLSREVIAFTAYLAVSSAYVLLLLRRTATGGVPPWLVEFVGVICAALAVTAAAASAMVYIATRRESWAASRVATQFTASIVLLGLTSGIAVVGFFRVQALDPRGSFDLRVISNVLCMGIAVMTLMKHFAQARRRPINLAEPLNSASVELRIARMLDGPLAVTASVRSKLIILSGLVLPILVAAEPWLSGQLGLGGWTVGTWLLIVMIFMVRMGSETLERYLFFVTAISRKMPGGVP